MLLNIFQCIRQPHSKELFSQNVNNTKKTSQTTFDTFDQSQHLLPTLYKSFVGGGGVSVVLLPFLK